jgi:hypothetical protein
VQMCIRTRAKPNVEVNLKGNAKYVYNQQLSMCSEHGPICQLFELILVIHANKSNGTNHIV